MNKRKGIRRLIALGSMSAFTLASFVTSTFAFVTLNTEATVSGFTFNITDQKGLLLSVDGDTFYQDIDAKLIKNVIEKNQNVNVVDSNGDGKVDENDNGYVTFANLSFGGVTLGGKASTAAVGDPYLAGVYSEDYSYTIGNYTVPIKDKRVTFVKDGLYEYTEAQRSAISTDTTGTYSSDYKDLVKENERVYGHKYEKANERDYVFFDLWAMVADDTQSGKNYSLKLSDKTVITGKEQTVTVLNKMTTPADVDLRTATTRNDGTTIVKGSYVAQDKITVNPANAMRLGITTLEGSTNSTNVDTTQTEMTAVSGDISVNVFEVPTNTDTCKNLGSYAVAGVTDTTTDAKYRNPALNAMYTYYNSLFPLSPFVSGVEDNGQLASIDKYTETELGVFTYDDTKTTKYNIIKLSVMVWLEGWDADYFAGISNAEVGVKLGFEIVEKN